MSPVNCSSGNNTSFYLDTIKSLEIEKEELEILIKEHIFKIKNDRNNKNNPSVHGIKYLKRQYDFVCYDLSYFENLCKNHLNSDQRGESTR